MNTVIRNGRTLPTGVQSFEKLREANAVYVDKTAYIYRLVNEITPFFLSRPRRFGKSLLLSTLAAYWSGKKELFSGLEIENLEAGNPEAWKAYPVFYFDFSGINYGEENALENVLDTRLSRWEQEYDCSPDNKSLSLRFEKLLIHVHQKTGLRSVILIDEYDKPLLDLIDDPVRQDHNKELFKGFFSNLKNCDSHIRFIFITGVTKFHKISIFSDLNQLVDISLNKDYSGICGITEDEMRTYFAYEIDNLAKEQEITVEKCMVQLKQTYDGYRFHEKGVSVYNPFSLLNAFFAKSFDSYWFETGTPTFLVKHLKEIDFDVRRFSNRTIYASASALKDYSADNPDPIPLLYQTGYLTISDYDPAGREYTLVFPNDEVKYGFLECLIPEYISDYGSGSGIDIFTLRRYINQGDLEGIKNVLTALFARITYTTKDDPFEHYFQSVIYLVFTLLGQFAECEMHTFTGRVDCRVETKDYVYLFEFKRDDSVDAALKQIEDKGYALPYAADLRKLYKIGVTFDSNTRMLSEWKAILG